MSLDTFADAVDRHYRDLDEEVSITLDEQTRVELAVLAAAYEPEDVDELVRRAVHLFAQDAVDRAAVDLQLRQRFGITYDEFLADVTYDEASGPAPSAEGGDRRYRF